MAMRILIVGAGAVGGYFGARLSNVGRDVTFLVRASRATQLRRGGLCVVSPHGDVLLTPKLIGAGEIDGPYDLVLLSVKAYALEAAIDDFAPAVGPETMILPVLNGMRHIDVLTQRFGESAVLGGVCLVATEIDNGGRIVQLADIQQLVYGERNGEVTARLQALDATLQGAGFEAHLSSDIIQAMWEKWVMLASLGAVTCLMRGAIGEVVAIPGGAELSLQVLNECAAVGAACGNKPSEVFQSRQAAAMTAQGSPLTSSMYRDLIKGAPVEVDHILGDLLRRAVREGVATPLLNAAFINLRIYQAGLSKHSRGAKLNKCSVLSIVPTLLWVPARDAPWQIRQMEPLYRAARSRAARATPETGEAPVYLRSGREPVMRMSTNLLALCCQSGLVATLATPTSARSRSIRIEVLTDVTALYHARFASAANCFPDPGVGSFEHLLWITHQRALSRAIRN